MRASLLILLLLAGAISGMLYWQWHSYTTTSDKRSFDEASQHFSVKHVNQELKITQTVTGLNDEKTYKIQKPQEIEEVLCTYENEESTCSQSETSLSFQPNNGSFILTYTLPFKKKDAAFVVDNWYVVLNNVKMKFTEVEVTEGLLRNGTWAAGAPLIGKVSLDLIDYFSFRKEGEAFPLYWQTQPLEYVEKGNYLSFYIKQPNIIEKMELNMELFDKLSFPKSTIIITDQHVNYNSPKLIITNQLNINDIQRSIVLENLSKQHVFSSLNERWMLEVFLPSIANIEIQNEKAKKMHKELTEKLTKAEFQAFVNTVFEPKDSKVTADMLDDLLGKQKGMKTNFFTANREEGLPVTPLYFFDNRTVIVNEDKKNLNILVEDGSLLFPFIETMKQLGFKVSTLSDNETLLVNKGYNAYRFYLNKNIFIYNEEDYGLLTNPLRNLHGTIYMDRYWLESIFKVSVSESENEIIVNFSS